MSHRSHLKSAAIAFSLAGVVGLLATSNASAFHFGGGQVSAPHFSGGGSGARPSLAHFSGGSGSGFSHHPSGSRGTPSGGHWTHAPQPTSEHNPHPGGDHSQHPRYPHWSQVGSHCGHWGYRCGPRLHYPVYGGGGDAPAYEGGGYSAPAPVYHEGPSYNAAPAPAPVVNTPSNTCVPGGTYITVVFQPTVTAAAITAFLKEYDVVMADGPNADGMYRIKISQENGSPDQFGQMIDSMRGRKDVISSIET